mmetsp:Transcript_89211/g.257209  ORF Transcript_89211/g.257209 Transcript_89211/m.257209 type:complete len:248 (+) Transcript_89211:544-1287(+)
MPKAMGQRAPASGLRRPKQHRPPIPGNRRCTRTQRRRHRKSPRRRKGRRRPRLERRRGWQATAPARCALAARAGTASGASAAVPSGVPRAGPSAPAGGAEPREKLWRYGEAKPAAPRRRRGRGGASKRWCGRAPCPPAIWRCRCPSPPPAPLPPGSTAARSPSAQRAWPLHFDGVPSQRRKGRRKSRTRLSATTSHSSPSRGARRHRGVRCRVLRTSRSGASPSLSSLEIDELQGVFTSTSWPRRPM